MPIIEAEDFKTPPLNTTIWRYMSFSKFCDLILNSQLFFSPLSKFDDPWECHPPKWMLDENIWIDIFSNKSSKDWPSNFSEEEIKNCSRSLVQSIINIYQNRDEYYASCWHNAPEETERFWKIYASKNEGIAIKSSIHRLKESLSNTSKKISIGEIEYIDFDKPFKNIKIESFYPIKYKRNGFKHEREVRAIFYHSKNSLKKGQTGAQNRLRIDLPTLIDEVWIAPNAQESFTNVINRLLDRSGLRNVQVKKSNYLDPPKISEKYEQEKFDLGNRVTGYFAVFDNEEEFNSWALNINKKLGYPSFGRNGGTGALNILRGPTTHRWSECIHHPDPSITQVLTVFTENMVDAKRKMISHEEAEKKGWFKQPIIS